MKFLNSLLCSCQSAGTSQFVFISFCIIIERLCLLGLPRTLFYPLLIIVYYSKNQKIRKKIISLYKLVHLTPNKKWIP